MKLLSGIIIILLSMNFTDIYAKKSPEKLEQRAIKYYIRAKFDKYFNTILNIIKKYPNSDISKLYLLSLKMDKPLFKNYENFIKLKESLLNRYRNDFFTYNILLTDIMNYKISKCDFKAAKKILKNSGIIYKWRYTKPFKETYYNDINKNFNNIEDSIPNINNWNKFNEETDWGWVPLQEISYPENGIIYASCNIYIKKDTDIIIWFVSDATTKFFINKQLIFKNDMRTGGKLNTIYLVHLKKGWHNFLLKLFNYKSSFDFKLKMLKKDGKAFTDYKISLNTENHIDNYKINFYEYLPPIYKNFQSKILSGSKHIIDYYHYGLLEFIFFNTQKSIDSLVRAKDLGCKNNFLINFLLGRIYMYSYTQNKNNILLDRSFGEFRSVLKLSPDFIRAKEYLARYYFYKNKINDAYDTLISIKKNYNNIFNLYSKYFQNINWTFMKNRYSIRAYELNKNYFNYIYPVIKFYKNYNLTNSNALLTNILKKEYIKNFAEIYINNLFDSGSTNFLSRIKTYHIVNPYDNFYSNKLSDYYLNKKDYYKAVNVLKATNFPDTLKHIGDIYYMKGNLEKSLYYYKRALKKQPINPSLEEKINYLQNKTFFYNIEKKYVKFINVKNIIDKAFNDKKKYNSNIKYYLDEMIIKINYNGSYTYLIHQIYKILNIDGKNNKGEVKIENAKSISFVKVINHISRSEKYEAYEKRKYNNTLFISVPKLKIGSVVEVIYQMNTKYSRLDNTKYFYGYPFLFQTTEAPVENSIYCVVVHNNFNLKWELRNPGEVESDVIKKKNHTVYIWQNEYADKVELEKKAVSIYDVVPNVYVSTIPKWDTILKWYKGKIHGNTSIGWELQKKMYELYQSATDNNKFKLITFLKNLYYYIQNEFSATGNYIFYPEDINNTFFKHKANAEKKIILFKSVLDKFNIRSDIILLKNKNFSKFNMKVPVPYYFSDILLYIPNQHNTKCDFYIDFANRFIPFKYIRSKINHCPAFDLKTNKIVRIKNDNKNKIIEKYTITVSSNNLNIVGKMKFIGVKNTAKNFFTDSFNRKSKIFYLINKIAPDISIIDYKILNFNSLKKNLIIKFIGTKKKIDEKDFIIDKFRLSELYIFKHKRTHNLHIYNSFNKKIIVSIKNYKIKDKKIILKNKFGTYKYICKDNKIIREILIDIQTIKKSEYNKFLEFCKKVDKIED